MSFKKIGLYTKLVLLLTVIVTCQTEKKYKDGEKKSKIISVSDPHSFSNPDQVRVTHLNLDLNIDWNKKVLRGHVNLDFDKKTSADTLILDTRNLKISKVENRNTNKPLKFWLGNEHPIFGSPLYIVLGEKDHSACVFYETSPDAEALQWLNPEQTHDKTDAFLYSQSQAILARSWVPCQDAPAVKFTYKASIRTKPGYLALMSASNPQKINETGNYTFNMEQPVSSYLLALSSGKIAFKAIGKDCGIYAEPGMLDKAVWEFADMQKMIDEASKLYGTYMWNRYDVLVLPPSFPFGGMENPRLTFATPTVITGDRSQVSLIAHELAHSWSGNFVTNATWNDFWLNEGFTNYFEQRIMEKVYGKSYDEMRQVLAWNDLEKTIAEMKSDGIMADTKLKLDLRDRNPDDGLSDIAYDKGRFFLCHLEKIVGKSQLDHFLKSYFKAHAFGFMDTEGFIAYLNHELLDKNPQWKKQAMVSQWIYGEGMPVSAIKPISSELKKVDQILNAYFTGSSGLQTMDTSGFTTHHWQYLIRQFGLKATQTQVKHWDNFFKFSNRSNAEICCDWYALSIRLGYKQNRPQIESFLNQVGRRKFLMPIYSELAKTNEGKLWANSVFKQAKKGYHSVSVHSVSEILK